MSSTSGADRSRFAFLDGAASRPFCTRCAELCEPGRCSVAEAAGVCIAGF